MKNIVNFSNQERSRFSTTSHEGLWSICEDGVSNVTICLSFFVTKTEKSPLYTPSKGADYSTTDGGSVIGSE